MVNTAWAAMALMTARYPDVDRIRAAIKLIRSRQLPNGSWAQESIVGNFNKNCMISYPNYVLIFTMWALGRYRRIYELGGSHDH